MLANIGERQQGKVPQFICSSILRGNQINKTVQHVLRSQQGY